MPQNVPWTIKAIQTELRLELEHRLALFMNQHKLETIKLVSRTSRCGDPQVHQIGYVKNGTSLRLNPWKTASDGEFENALKKAQARHRITLLDTTDLEVTLTVSEAPGSVLDSESGSPDLDQFSRECNALAASITIPSPNNWLEIAQITNCFTLTPLASLVITRASSTILWYSSRSEAGAQQLRPLHVAGARTVHRGRRPPLTLNFGDGVVGRAAATRRQVTVSSQELRDLTRSPDLVQAEGWVAAVAIPLLFGDEVVGVFSLYYRDGNAPEATDIPQISSIVPIATLHAARRSRLASIDYDQKTLMRGVMRLQSGLTMIGYVHDLARHAKQVHEWATMLREPLKTISMKAGIEATVEDMIKSADLVGSLTARMDNLALGRQDRESKIAIHTVLSEMSPLLHKLDPRISVDIQGEATIRGPESTIERIVLNLVTNSLNWTENDSRDIKVKFERSPASNTAMLSVTDNGQGILPERIARITQPFVSFRENGSGLGLYLVSELSKRVGAKPPMISSTPYQATTVRIKFLRLLDTT